MRSNRLLPSLLTSCIALGACSDDDTSPDGTELDSGQPDTGDGSSADAATDVDDTDASSPETDTVQEPDVQPDGDTPDTADADAAEPDAEGSFDEPTFALEVGAMWPKFRYDGAQTGRTDRTLTDDGSEPWVVQTGKGIFSSPVVSADGTIYVGSANRIFYALNPDGSVKWQVETGEIIDSAALLDDTGGVYVGSGDGFLYAFDAATGEERWAFEAEAPGLTGAYLNWFEGNVAIAPSGLLVVPNDNFRVYAVDRTTGTSPWSAIMPDQTWSSPTFTSSRVIIGNNNVLGANTFAFDFDGIEQWAQGTLGSISGSPTRWRDRIFLGGFDGTLRAHSIETGRILWSFLSRDHIYASTALLADGTVILPSADGTVYALDPLTGEQIWAYDHGAPIRSSPAVDGLDQIYLGTGDGRILVLNGDGTRRFSFDAIEPDRDDINSSPALGAHAVYVGSESGDIVAMPYDYCLRADLVDERCDVGASEPLADDIATVLYTTRFGTTAEPDEDVAPNQALAFTLVVREDGDTVLGLLNDSDLFVTVTPEQTSRFIVSADRRFVTLLPDGEWEFDETTGDIEIIVSGTALVNPERDGLATEGGEPGPRFTQTFTFSRTEDAGWTGPSVKSSESNTTTVFEMQRLAAPLPTLLPSYNQIGFDSLHFLVSFVNANEDNTAGLAWVVEGRPDEDGVTRVVPDTAGMFAFQWERTGSHITMFNNAGMELIVLNFPIGFQEFRVSGTINEDGSQARIADVTAITECAGIEFYGAFLRRLGLCNPDTDLLTAFGAVQLGEWTGGNAPEVVPPNSNFEVDVTPGRLRLDIGINRPDPNHRFAIILTDADTGTPVPMSYAERTSVELDEDGNVSAVLLDTTGLELPETIAPWAMADTWLITGMPEFPSSALDEP